MKVICGLGNPGPEYAATRHNVGWWLVERLAEEWDLGPWRSWGMARIASGVVGDNEVLLLEPLTYMNRSGSVLVGLSGNPEFDPARDLLVIVDDVALPPGRVRLRARGSSGGHNGLKSIESALGTQEYARLRIGVGAPPRGVDLADWVLSSMSSEEEESVLELFPSLVEGVRTWLEEGSEAAMSRLNRLVK